MAGKAANLPGVQRFRAFSIQFSGLLKSRSVMKLNRFFYRYILAISHFFAKE
jgi:hypothetical protein